MSYLPCSGDPSDYLEKREVSRCWGRSKTIRIKQRLGIPLEYCEGVAISVSRAANASRASCGNDIEPIHAHGDYYIRNQQYTGYIGADAKAAGFDKLLLLCCGMLHARGSPVY